MNTEEFTNIKRRIQAVEQQIEEIESDTDTLFNNNVDTSTSNTLSQEQQDLQDELEQLTSDLLAVLDKSDAIDAEDGSRISLPGNGRNPVSAGTLPQPTIERPAGRGPPAWVSGGSSGGN